MRNSAGVRELSHSSLILALALAMQLAACDRDRRPREAAPQIRAPADRDAGPSARALPASSASAVTSALARIRESTLKLGPGGQPSQTLAIGKGRLAQLTDDGLFVRALPDWRVVAREQIKGPRAVITLVDGSLLALGFENTHRLQPHTTKFERLPRVSAFPGSVVLADRSEPRQFLVMHGFASSLYHYRIDSPDAGSLETLRFFEFAGFDRRGFGALRDGSFMYTAGNELFRFFAGGKKTKLSVPIAALDVWRILPAKRLDQAWLASTDGRLLLSELAGSTLRVVDTLKLKGTVHDLGIDEETIAVVRVEQPADQPRRWFLSVIDTKGREKLEVELSSDAGQSQGEDWAKLVTRNKTVALSSRQSLVAVGGPSSLDVWDLTSGKSVLLP